MPLETAQFHVEMETPQGFIYPFQTAKGTFYMLVGRGNRGMFVYDTLTKARRVLLKYSTTAAAREAPDARLS